MPKAKKYSQEELRNQMKIVRDDMDELMQAVEDNPTDATAEVARNAGKSIRQWADESKDRAIEAREKAEKQIRSYPFSSILGAFAIGAAAAALFARRR